MRAACLVVFSFLILCSLFPLSDRASACASVGRRGPVRIHGEEALIVWDPAHQKQHFVRVAGFEPTDEDFGVLVGDGHVESFKDGVPGLEAHPGQGVGGVGVGRYEGQAVLGFGWEQGTDDLAVHREAVIERLRRHETPREGDVELARIGVPTEGDLDLLRLAT